MRYFLSSAVLLALATPARADNVFDCQDVGNSAPETISEQQALIVDTFSCRVTSGPMAGALMTGTIAWDVTKGVGNLVSGTGVIRKPGSLVVYKDGDGTLNLTMNDKGQPTGFTGNGTATWVFATGEAASYKGKVFNWTAKSNGPGTFEVHEPTD